MARLESLIALLVEESHGSLGFYDTKRGTCVGRVALGLNPHEIAVSRDGTRAYVSLFGLKDYDETIGRPGNAVAVIDVAARCEVDRLYTCAERPYLAPHGLGLSADESHLYVNTEAVAPDSGLAKHALLVFDLRSKNSPPKVVSYEPPEPPAGFAVPSAHLEIPHGTHTLLVEEGERTVLLSAGPAGLYRLDLASGKVVRNVRVGASVRGLLWTSDRAMLIVSSVGEVALLDPSTLEPVERFADLGVGQVLYTVPTPDDRYLLAPAVWESQVLRIDRKTREIARLLVGLDPIHIRVTPDGETAFVTHGRSLFATVVDVRTWREIRRISTKGGPNGIALVPATTPREPATIYFGACLPLSGANSAEGRDIRLGYQLWQETVNAAGGVFVDGAAHFVDVLYADTGSSVVSDEVARLTRELRSRGAAFFLGGYPSGPNLDVGRVAEEFGCPFVTGTGAGEFIYNAGLRHVFGIMAPARSYLRGSVEVALQQQPRPTRLLILSCDDKAALEDAAATARFAVEQGMRLVTRDLPDFGAVGEGVITHPHGHVDFLALFRVLAEDVGGLLFMHAGHLPEAISVAESMREARFSPLGIGFSVGPAIPSFRARLGRSCRALLGSTQWVPLDTRCAHDRHESAATLSGTFYARYSKEMSYLAAAAMGCGVTFEDAFRRAGTLEPEAVRMALASTDLRTSFAEIRFDHRGLNVEKPMLTIQLQERGAQIVEVPLLPNPSPATTTVWPFPGWDQTS